MKIDTSVRDQLDKQEAAINNLLAEIKKRDARIAELEAGLEWITEVHHVANFHNVTDWHKCNSVTCNHTRTVLKGVTK